MRREEGAESMSSCSESQEQPRPERASCGSVSGDGAAESPWRSQAPLQAFIDAIPIPMSINRMEDGRILHANWRAEAAFGLPRGGAIGRRSAEFYHDPAGRDALLAEFRKRGRLQDYEVQVQKADGTPFWVLVSMEAASFEGQPALLVAFYDVTARKEAEEALRASERLFRTLAETVAAGITIVQDGVLRYVNPMVTRLMGYSAEEMIGKPPWEFVHPETRPETEQRSHRREEGSEEATRFEIRVLTKDGRELWVDQSVAIIEYDGRYATMSAGLDITHRKQMEARIRETEERYRTLVENVDLGIALIDKNHTILMSNAAQGRMMAKPVGELVGKKCYRELEQREEVCRLCPGAIAMSTGQPAEMDRKGVREDGSSFDVRIHAFPLFEPGGSPLGFVEVVEDITERKRAEQAIAESEAKYRTLVEQLPAIIYTTPPHAGPGTDYISPYVEKVLGYSPAEFVQNPNMWRDHIHPDDRAGVLAALEAFFAVGGTYAAEYRMIAHGGRIVWFRDEGRIIRDESGTPLFMQGVMVDITERKRAEEELRVGRQKLAEIIAGTRVGTWEWNVQTGALVLNDRWAEIVGYTLEELSPISIQTWLDLVHPDDLAKSNALLQQCFAGELDYYDCECRMKHKDGSWVWILDRGRVFEWTDDGKPLRMMGTHSDITAGKRAEQSLIESEAKYRTLVEQMPAMVFRTPYETPGRTTYMSQYVQTALGYTPTEFVRDDLWRERLHPADRDRVLTQVSESLAQGLPFASEYRMIARDGRTVWLSDQATIVRDESGHPICLQGVMVDITERKRAEEELRVGRQKLAEIIAGAHVGTWEWNVQTGDTVFDDRWAEITGYTSEELRPATFQTWADLVHPDDLAMANAQLQKHFAGELDYYACEFRMKHRDGSWVWVSARGRVIEWAGDGKPLRMMGTHSDITARKRAERAIAESEAKYRTLVEQIPAIIHTSPPDRPSATSYVNPYVEKVLGYKPGEYETEDLWRARLHPDDRNRVLAELSKSVAESGSFASEYRMIAQDGRTVWIRDEAAVVRDERGVPLFLQGVMLDITERKRAEVELRKFKTISDRSPHGHAIIDLEGNVLYVNAAFARMHGYEPEEFLCKHISDFHTQDQMPGVNRLIGQLKREGRFVGQEVWHKRRDGTVFPTLMDAAVVIDEEDVPLFFSVMAADISDRKAAEATLRRQALVFDNINDGVIITDAEGRITDWNPGAERMFDYLKQEVVGRSAEMLNRPEEAKAVSRGIQEGLRRDGYWSSEMDFIRKDGSEGTAEAFLVPLRDERRKVIGRISVNRDITARKHAEAEKARLEAQLHQAQKMEAVGTLAGGVAHDFNNLLTAIFGYTDLAKNSLPVEHPAVQSLEMVEQAGRQARGVINSLLTFSQKGVPVKAPVNVASSLAETVELLRRLLPASIEIERHLPADSEVWVNADGTQLQQVWMNLAVNARDAMPRGGRLCVTLREPESDRPAGAQGGDRLPAIVVIEDNGVGMSEEIRSRVFEPFFTTKPRGHGTGLGLPVTHAIVAHHDGEIVIESREGRGTRVTVSLPTCDPPPKSLRKAAQPRRSVGRGELVLVVEDNEHVRSILVSELRRQGCQVVAAANSAEARAFLRRHDHAPDLVLLDLDLPGTRGTSLLRSIRRKLPKVPIVIVTGSVNVGIREKPERNQFLLRKPLEMSELDEYVARLLDQSPRKGEEDA